MKLSVAILISFTAVTLSFGQSPNGNVYPLITTKNVEIGNFVVKDRNRLKRGTKGTINFYIHDKPNARVFLTNQESNPDLLITNNELIWTPPYDTESKTISIRITNKNDNDSTLIEGMLVSIPIERNIPPKDIYGTTLTHSIREGIADTLDLKKYFKNEDGDEITYSWISEPLNIPLPTSDGLIITPPDIQFPPSTNDVVTGVIGISDALEGISLAITFEFTRKAVKPEWTIPTPNSAIFLGKKKETDQVGFGIKAIDPNNPTAEIVYSLAGNTYGLEHKGGNIVGTLPYDVIANYEESSYINGYKKITVKLRATASETNLYNEVDLILEVSNLNPPEQFDRYSVLRNQLISEQAEYLNLIEAIWNDILWKDINALKDKNNITNTINWFTKNGVGGAVNIVSGATLTAVASTLGIVGNYLAFQNEINANAISQNIEAIVEQMNIINMETEEFLSSHPSDPSNDVNFQTINSINEVDNEVRRIINIYRDSKLQLGGIDFVHNKLAKKYGDPQLSSYD
ncbi:MAG: hypothetical protein RIF33_03590 [Cyclobacteriaceae bacterium]